jgi:hypothetical protein
MILGVACFGPIYFLQQPLQITLNNLYPLIMDLLANIHSPVSVVGLPLRDCGSMTKTRLKGLEQLTGCHHFQCATIDGD